MPKSTMQIKTGTYFGESFGYSDDQLLLTPEKMVYTRKSSIASPELPDKVIEFPMPDPEWQAVCERIDWRVLNSLPDRFGRPDQHDQGGEFLEVAEGDQRMRVEFEPGAPPPEIADLMKKLSEMRREAAGKMPR